MSESSITLILNQLRQAACEEDRQAAAAKLYRCYRGQVEKVARGRLSPGGGLADEEDVAQSAFRSFFSRIETGQLDALVTGGQAWAILARLTRNKAIDSVRYDNALCRGGEGARRGIETGPQDSGSRDTASRDTASRDTGANSSASQSGTRSLTRRMSSARPTTSMNRDRLGIGDAHDSREASETIKRSKTNRRREDFPLDALRDHGQRSSEEEAESKEVIDRFLQQLSEATLRGIVALKLQGFTNEEIAKKLGCATRTIERKLNLIRRLWIPILENSDEQRSP